VSEAALVTAGQARALDAEASAEWGLNPFALVEAAGRSCAAVCMRSLWNSRRCTEPRGGPRIVVLAGGGNNAADALVLLRSLILDAAADPAAASVLPGRLPPEGEPTPLSAALLALERIGVPARAWDAEPAAAVLRNADIVIDGITGTGLNGPLHGAAREMATAVNALRGGRNAPLVVSIDTPSGLFDGWRPGMPVVAADATLAIEPQKRCLYAPAARPFAGTILPVTGIFPPALTAKYADAALVDWRGAAARIPPAPPDAHKYRRGLAEIRAGSPGAAGAAQLAARGAQAAGAGLVRLIVDPSLYPALAPGMSGVMVVPDGAAAEEGRFTPDAVLLGPGWGRLPDRARLLEASLPREAQGVPLILDADAIALAGDRVFHGNAILTPHPGEFAAYTGIPTDELLADPVPALRRFAGEKQAHILFKGHVLYVVSPDGRMGVIDGMNPALAAGGTGDVLAGLCAGIAARQRAMAAFDGYACAAAAAALVIAAGRSKKIAGRFIDPSALAQAAALIAGRAWLPGEQYGR
jgi:NAD(P)H-hydrate epimerase